MLRSNPGNVIDPRSMVLLQTQSVRDDTFSTVASIDFTDGIDGSFNEYVFKIRDFKSTSTGDSLRVRTSNDGISFDAGTTDYVYSYINQTASTSSNGAAQLQILSGITNLAAESGYNGTVTLVSPMNTDINTSLYHAGSMATNVSNTNQMVIGGGWRKAQEIVRGIRFYTGSGMIAYGSIAMYGVK